jgi:DNA-binding response OmpR family regulator
MVMSGGVAGTSVDLLEIATRLGASSVLAKPFSTDALIKAIDALLPPGKTSPEGTV